MLKHNLMLKSIFLVLIAAAIYACSKDDGKTESKSDLIIGEWKTIKVEVSPAYDYDGDGISDSDIFPVWEDCNKDDYTSIKPNAVYEVNRGSIKCFSSQPQVDIGTWALANNDNTLVIDGQDQFEILQLDNTTLKVKFVENDNGTTRTSISTSIRK